jgi:hypothetical protein
MSSVSALLSSVSGLVSSSIELISATTGTISSSYGGGGEETKSVVAEIQPIVENDDWNDKPIELVVLFTLSLVIQIDGYLFNNSHLHMKI